MSRSKTPKSSTSHRSSASLSHSSSEAERRRPAGLDEFAPRVGLGQHVRKRTLTLGNVRSVKTIGVFDHEPWATRAACRNAAEPRWWLDDPVSHRDDAERALAVCASCRVRRECLDAALAESAQIGIWGGTLPAERTTRSAALAAQARRFGIEEAAS